MTTSIESIRRKTEPTTSKELWLPSRCCVGRTPTAFHLRIRDTTHDPTTSTTEWSATSLYVAELVHEEQQDWWLISKCSSCFHFCSLRPSSITSLICEAIEKTLLLAPSALCGSLHFLRSKQKFSYSCHDGVLSQQPTTSNFRSKSPSAGDDTNSSWSAHPTIATAPRENDRSSSVQQSFGKSPSHETSSNATRKWVHLQCLYRSVRRRSRRYDASLRAHVSFGMCGALASSPLHLSDMSIWTPYQWSGIWRRTSRTNERTCHSTIRMWFRPREQSMGTRYSRFGYW